MLACFTGGCFSAFYFHGPISGASIVDFPRFQHFQNLGCHAYLIYWRLSFQLFIVMAPLPALLKKIPLFPALPNCGLPCLLPLLAVERSALYCHGPTSRASEEDTPVSSASNMWTAMLACCTGSCFSKLSMIVDQYLRFQTKAPLFPALPIVMRLAIQPSILS